MLRITWIQFLLLLFTTASVGAKVAKAGQAIESFVPGFHEVRHEQFWRGRWDSKTDIESRIWTAPPELIDYLVKDNRAQGYKDIPKRFSIGKTVTSDFRAAVGAIPKNLKELLKEKLVGVFVVSDLGSSGYTDTVFAQDWRPVGAFVILDATLLQRNANDWATWRESSPFTKDAKITVHVKIEDSQDNNARNALQYILLHEFGHVLGTDSRVHPSWSNTERASATVEGSTFSKISWKNNQSATFTSKFDREFKTRSRIRFYADTLSKVTASLIPEIYDRLATTDFPTLYSATNPFDDFADSFANYVHTQILRRPYEVTLRRQNGSIKVMNDCWNEIRCKEKKEFLFKLLEEGPAIHK